MHIKPSKMKKQVEILRGLDRYIQHWTHVATKDGLDEIKAYMSYLGDY